MPSNHLLFCYLLLPSIFPSIRVFSIESVLHIRWPKYWSFSLSTSPSNEYSGPISFMMDWLDPCCPRDSQESSPTPQFKSINSSVLSLLYGPSLTPKHDYWKNHSFDYTDLRRQSDISDGLDLYILDDQWYWTPFLRTFLCLLWKSVYLGPWSILKLDYLLYYFWAAGIFIQFGY